MAIKINNKSVLKSIKPKKVKEEVKEEVKEQPKENKQDAIVLDLYKQINDLSSKIDSMAAKPPVNVVATIKRDKDGKMDSIIINER